MKKKLFLKEVCKFLSGAFFVSAGVNWWMYFNDMQASLFGMILTPKFLGIRGFIHFGLFLITFFFGFIKKMKEESEKN
jgi:hypothetical protein